MKTAPLFRASSVGRLMTGALKVDAGLLTEEIEAIQAKKKRTDEEKQALAKALEMSLSVGAKTFVRELATQAIFGVDFEVSSKAMQKGVQCESESIALLNEVCGLSLAKCETRITRGGLTGEADCINRSARTGYDLKTSWSVATFPAFNEDRKDSLYEWQARAYMALYDLDNYYVVWCLVDTPEELIGHEPMQLHAVGHIPKHLRVTTWHIERDRELEKAMFRKIQVATDYYKTVIAEFDAAHPKPLPRNAP